MIIMVYIVSPAARMARCLCLILLFLFTALALPLDHQSSLIQPTDSNSTGITDPAPTDSSSDLTVASEPRLMAKTKAIAFLSSLIIYVSLNSLAHSLNPAAFVWSAEDREEPA